MTRLMFLILILIFSGIFYSLTFFTMNTTSTTTITPQTSPRPANLATAYFAGGCFWCMEGIFESQTGVTEAISGYAGGSAEDATYDLVSL